MNKSKHSWNTIYYINNAEENNNTFQEVLFMALEKKLFAALCIVSHFPTIQRAASVAGSILV